ncbi:PA2779 family protein [Bdellovibrio sp. HCB-162]|uniref:PA2779 family protein n=1 Tax=Bdellovibrio sp. HCB-162 TaxID=3394234 RepID=UPI0039BD09A7
MFSKPFKIAGAVSMSAFVSHVPQVALAAPGMISTRNFVEQTTRAQDLQTVQDYLSRTDVQKALMDRGLSAEEASSRLASLSEAELKQLSDQIHKAQAGGDILVTILVIVLIIFLIKRI